MKIVCDNCTTKYQIADEKVSGKAFKIRCKKCGHVIVVNKSPGEASSAQQAQPEPGAAPAEAAPPPAEPAPASDAVWHLVIDREQVGPMTAEEVKAKIKGGQVDAETYGWKEGFEDWLKLSAIDNFKGDFASRGSDDQATRRAEPAAIQQQQQQQPMADPGADLFGAAAAQAPRTASPAAPTLMTDNAGADVMAARAQAEPPMSSGQESEALGAGKGMKGARSENSVLFSLNNLSALAGGSENQGRAAPSAAADKPGYANVQSEASGLIDIRAMAAAHLSSSNQGGPSSNRGPDMLMGHDIAPVFAPVATNMLMPSAEPQGIPKWVFALVGVGGLAIVGMIVFLIIYLQAPTPPVVTTGPGTTGPGAVTAPGIQPGTAPTPSGPDTAAKPAAPSSGPTSPGSTATPPTKPSGSDSGSSRPSRPSRSDKGDKGDKPSKSKDSAPSAKPDKEPDIPAPPPKAEPPVKKEKPPKAKDDLDSLLDTASSGSGGKPKAAEKKDLPEQLSRDQISSGFKGAATSACKGEGASGIYNVKLTIGRNGRVSDANVVSGGDGKDCVAKAVKGAKFPEFSGDPMSLTYPFIVR